MNSHRQTLSSSLRDSMLSILGIERAPHSPAAVAAIRKAMLAELGDCGPHRHPTLAFRIRRTDDATGLWFARAELYAHLCHQYSEAVALERVQKLTPLFVGWVPTSLMKGRPS